MKDQKNNTALKILRSTLDDLQKQIERLESLPYLTSKERANLNKLKIDHNEIKITEKLYKERLG